MRSADICRQRAAASSMASGMPSRRWQIWAIAGAFASPTANDGRARCARSTNSATASYCDSAGDRRAGRRRRAAQRRHPPGDLAGHAERLTARRQHRHRRTGGAAVRRRTRRTPRRDAHSCPSTTRLGSSPSSTASWLGQRRRRQPRGRPRRPARRDRSAPGSANGASSTHHTPPAYRSSSSADDRQGEAGLADPRRTGQASPAARRPAAAHLGDLVSTRPMSGVSWTGRL